MKTLSELLAEASAKEPNTTATGRRAKGPLSRTEKGPLSRTERLQNRRETLRTNRNEMERRSAWAWAVGHAADAAFYAAEAERLAIELDGVNAELIAAGH